MTTQVRGNRDLIKAMNRSLILNTLRREGHLSRTQLTEISGLSVGAVSQITNELLDTQMAAAKWARAITPVDAGRCCCA